MVDDQCIASDQASISVTWDEVTATNSDSQPITCVDDAGGTSVTVTGGDFPVGSHTVTCTVTNDGNCTASASFTFDVIGKSLNLEFDLSMCLHMCVYQTFICFEDVRSSSLERSIHVTLTY